MSAWVDKDINRDDDALWDSEIYRLGDWLDPLAPLRDPGNGRTNGTLPTDVYLFHVTSKLVETVRYFDDQVNLERYRQIPSTPDLPE